MPKLLKGAFNQDNFATDNGHLLANDIVGRIRKDLNGEPITVYKVNPEGDPVHIAVNKLNYFLSLSNGDSKNSAEAPKTEVLAEVWNCLSAADQERLAATHPELATLPRTAIDGQPPGIDIDGQPPQIDIDQLPDIESLKASPVTWMIKDLFVDGTLNIITGDPGGGKTYLAAGIAGAVAEGLDFAGLPVTQAPVVYIDREGQRLGLFQKRIAQLGIETGPNLKIWGTWISGEPPLPSSPSLVAWARKHDRCLIILDSQIAFMDGRDENDAVAMREFSNFCRTLTKEGATVIILHHTGRGNDSRYRGSSDILAAADALYFAKKINKGLKLESLRLTVEKSRELVIPELNLRLDDDGRGWSLDTTKPEPQDQGDDRRSAKLKELLQQNAGITLDAFGKLAASKKLGRDPARAFLKQGVKDKLVTQTPGPNNALLHTWIGGAE